MTEELRAALAAGPTPGPWTVVTEGHAYLAEIVGPEPDHDIRVANSVGTADARYIAACSPDKIALLLADNDRLRAALTQIASTPSFSQTRCSGWLEVERVTSLARAALAGASDE